MTFSLQVSDDGLDGGAAAQLALDDTEDAALLAGDEDAAGILRLASGEDRGGIALGPSSRLKVSDV